METKSNIVGWFEIPVIDMDRAVKFYEAVFDIKLARHKLGTLEMAWFPWTDKSYGAGGSLVLEKNHYKPSTDGVLIYLSSASGDLGTELAKVEKAGGRILQQKKQIGEHGFMALFTDTEGNRIAMHSMN